jgi:MFS family permease
MYSLIRANAAFRSLWTARAVSFLGGSVSSVALILYVAGEAGTGAAVALLMLVGEALPSLLAPVAGALADRMEPRRLMVVCEVGQGVVLALVAVLLPGLPVLLALVAVKSLFAVVFDPAGRSVLPRLVADRDLERANAALGVGTYGLDVAGPLAAAALLPALGVRGVLWLDVATFGASAVLLGRLPRLPRPERPATEAAAGIWADIGTGLRYLFRHRVVRMLALCFWVVVLCTGLDDVVLVFLARDRLHAGDSGVSLLYAGVGLGLLVGLAYAARRRPAVADPAGGRASRRRAVAGALAVVAGLGVSAAGNLLTGLAWALWAALAFQAVRGLGIAAVEVGLPAVVARSVPEHLRGRMFALVYGGVSLAAALSYVAGGAALGVMSPGAVLVVAGALGTLTCAVVGWALHRVSDDQGR